MLCNIVEYWIFTCWEDTGRKMHHEYPPAAPSAPVNVWTVTDILVQSGLHKPLSDKIRINKAELFHKNPAAIVGNTGKEEGRVG